jgi:hypothetical protein
VISSFRPYPNPPSIGGADSGRALLVIELLPIVLHDVLQPVVEGIRAKHFLELVACMGLYVLHDLRNDQAKIEEAKHGAGRLRLLGRRAFGLEQDWLREAVRPLKRPDGGGEARVEIGARG